MPLFSLNFPDDAPLFCLAFHPEKPQFLVGLATGRVVCYEYTVNGDSALPVELWSTKRHKESCRAIAYNQTGQFAISCGSDGVIKKFDSQSGKVGKKTEIGAPASALAINEEYIAVGDEEGKLHILKMDLSVHRVYDLEGVETVSSIASLDVFNKHNFAVSGEMHVFRVDARKDEVVSKSEDQEDEVLCGCIASETRSAWGLTEGVLTIWKNKGLMDQQQRVKLSKEGSVDAVIAAEQDDHVIAGTSEGWVAQVDLVSAQIVHRARHNPADPEDEVLFLDFDHEYRMVSASMSYLRVWNEGELELAESQEKAASEAKAAKARKASEAGRKKSKKGKISEPKAFADLLD